MNFTSTTFGIVWRHDTFACRFPDCLLFTASSLNSLREKGGSPTRKLIGHSGPVYSLAFDPVTGSAAQPQYLLSGSADATARLWSMDTMTNIVAYRGHQNPVWDVDWSPMGIYFTTASRDRTARLWSTDRTSTLRIYAGHSSDVDVSTRKCRRLSETHLKQCVRFHPNSLYIATGSSDWTARLWDVQRGTSVRVFIGHQGIVSTLAFSPDGRYLATTGKCMSITSEHLTEWPSRRRPIHKSVGPWVWTPSKKDDWTYSFSIFTGFQCRVFGVGQWWGGLDCQVLGRQKCGRAT